MRGPVAPGELRDELDLSRTKVATAVHRLEEAGLVEVRDDGQVEAAHRGADLDEGVEEAAQAEVDREAFDRSRVEMMRGYAEADGCRRVRPRVLRRAVRPAVRGVRRVRRGSWRDLGRRRGRAIRGGRALAHREWGPGTVQRTEDDMLTVVFDGVGYKTLALEVIEENGLLEPVDDA